MRGAFASPAVREKEKAAAERKAGAMDGRSISRAALSLPAPRLRAACEGPWSRVASEDEPTIRRRLSNALGEIEHYGFFDYVVVNDDLQDASSRLESIVIAERSRRVRRAALAEGMLRDARAKR